MLRLRTASKYWNDFVNNADIWKIKLLQNKEHDNRYSKQELESPTFLVDNHLKSWKEACLSPIKLHWDSNTHLAMEGSVYFSKDAQTVWHAGSGTRNFVCLIEYRWNLVFDTNTQRLL